MSKYLTRDEAKEACLEGKRVKKFPELTGYFELAEDDDSQIVWKLGDYAEILIDFDDFSPDSQWLLVKDKE